MLLAGIMSALAAQGDNPVRWRTIVKAGADGNGTVTFRALISPGWHLYGLELPEGGPKATNFDLAGSKGVKFTGKVKPARTALSVEDPLFGMTLSWWDSNVEFTVPFRVTDPAEARIICKISYMACDGSSCRPPITENISAPGKITKSELNYWPFLRQ